MFLKYLFTRKICCTLKNPQEFLFLNLSFSINLKFHSNTGIELDLTSSKKYECQLKNKFYLFNIFAYGNTKSYYSNILKYPLWNFNPYIKALNKSFCKSKNNRWDVTYQKFAEILPQLFLEAFSKTIQISFQGTRNTTLRKFIFIFYPEWGFFSTFYRKKISYKTIKLIGFRTRISFQDGESLFNKICRHFVFPQLFYFGVSKVDFSVVFIFAYLHVCVGLVLFSMSVCILVKAIIVI